MFSIVNKLNHKWSVVVLFIIIPLVFILNYVAGAFIGGLLVVSTCISAIVLRHRGLVLYFLLDIMVFIAFANTKNMNMKTLVIQGSIFIISLLAAGYAGLEIGHFIQVIKLRKEQNCQLIQELIYAFVTAIDAKDQYLHNHSYNVSYYAKRIASAMGMTGREIEMVGLAALLHDIGKLNVPDKVLNKPSKLTDEEWALMRQHTYDGVNILHNIERLQFLFPMIKYHHRHFDGSGYPDDCLVQDIPIEARIIAVADSFDAMTSNRPYRNALQTQVAYEELRTYSGSQFDPVVVEAFFKAKIEPKKIEKHNMNLALIFELNR